MPDKNEKRITELPTEEAIRRLFPPEVIQMAQEVAHEKDEPRQPKPPPSPTG